jgi:DNA-binding transcriptional LysR family regulator
MTPTERALELEPLVREALARIDRAVQPRSEFRPAEARGVFRIMASDYAESTLLPRVLGKLRRDAPGITLDIMTPSDVSFLDVERGKVDMVINRFDAMPQSFHQVPSGTTASAACSAPVTRCWRTSRWRTTSRRTTCGSARPAWGSGSA